MTEIEFEYADYCINKLRNSCQTFEDIDEWFNSKSHRDNRLTDKELKNVRSILSEDNWIIKQTTRTLYKFNESKTKILKKYGSFSNYRKSIDENIQLLKSKSDKKEQLETKIAVLTEINLTLQNKQLKTKMLFSIIGFFIGFIAANWKDILIILKIISPPETK